MFPVMRWRWLTGLAVAVGLLGLAAGGSASDSHLRDVLRPDGIGGVRFGAPLSATRTRFDSLLRETAHPYRQFLADCGVDAAIVWWDSRTANGLPDLVAYFDRSKFTGYQYGEYETK